jgi:peptidoglycan hydrolase CwlO-like protein
MVQYNKPIMRKILQCLIPIVIVICGVGMPRVYAQSCDTSNLNNINLDELAGRKAKCEEAWSQMEAAKKPHVETLRKMEADIVAFQARIKTIEANLVKKAVEIAAGEKELVEFMGVASVHIRSFYIRRATYNPLSSFLASENVGLMLRTLAYQQAITNQDKKLITQTAVSVTDLEERKKSLENEKAALASIKAETDKRAVSVRKLVADAEAYQTQLTGIIAALSAQQQAILNARSGTFTTSVGDVPLADDPNASPNYNPGFSPAYAGFSFGAYTHRKGMSQYGAKGRANLGQNYHDILKAYYGCDVVSQDSGGNISVSGYGGMDFENKYLMGIAEMPADFPGEALKAQAVAARSYAWSYKSSGGTICTSQSCQVYNEGKANNPPGQWRDAVNATRGQIIQCTTAFYSSTTGGYSTTTGWDTKCGNQGCWTGDAYEKIAGSPWFYKGWYTADYFNSSAKCNRSSPWLNNDEFADIINAWYVRKNGGDASRILPVTINNCSINGATGNPYSMDELKNMGGVTSVSNVSVSYNSGGYTDTVHVSTNKGQLDIPGSEFKEAFNLRAPGYISIRSPLYNIEKK